MRNFFLGLLTTIQPWFTLSPRARAKVQSWFGESFREAAVLIFVFLAADKYLVSAISPSLAARIIGLGAAVYIFGLKFGLDAIE